MKEYQKPSIILQEINLEDILAVSVNDGMFNLGMGMGEEEIGGFDEIW